MLRLIYTTQWFSDLNCQYFDFENIILPELEVDLNFLIVSTFTPLVDENKKGTSVLYNKNNDDILIYINYLHFKDEYIGLYKLNVDSLNNIILNKIETFMYEKGLIINDRITTNNQQP